MDSYTLTLRKAMNIPSYRKSYGKIKVFYRDSRPSVECNTIHEIPDADYIYALDCTDCKLDKLPILPPKLAILSIANNQFKMTLDLSYLQHLELLDCSGNDIQSLKLPNCIMQLNVVGNFHLEPVDLTNSELRAIEINSQRIKLPRCCTRFYSH